ncbi:MAG: ATP-binding protein [Flavobacteriales bacterium]
MRALIDRCIIGIRRSALLALLSVQAISALAQSPSLRAFYDRGNTIFLKGTALQQRAFLDSLVAHPNSDPDQRAMGRIFIARGYRSKGEARRALEMLDSVQTEVDTAHSTLSCALHNERARGLKQLKMFPEAMDEAHRSHQVAVELNLHREEVNTLVLLAEIQRAQGQYEPALANLIEAEKLATRIGYANGLCNVAINRGNLLNWQERYNEARVAYRHARECAEASGDLEIASNALFNEAGIIMYVYPDSSEVAVAILRGGLKRARADGDREFEADLLAELGRTHNEHKRFREAINELRASLVICEEREDTLGRTEKLLFLSSSYRGAGLPDSALACAREAADLGVKSHDLEREAEATMRIAELLVSLGRPEEANTYFKAYIDKREALMKARNGETIKVMEYRFETEKKVNTIRQQDEQIASDRVKKRGILAIAVLLLIVTGLAIRNNQHMRRVSAQQQQLHEREVNDLLKRQEIRALDAMMQGQETERTRIAKDLHDRLGSMLSAVKLQFSALESRTDALREDQERQYKRVFGMLDEAVSEVRRISHDLMKSSLSRYGLNGALQDLRASLQAPGKLEVEMNLFGLEARMDQSVEVAVYRIIQECVSNTLKHAQATTLAIQVTRSVEAVNIIVEDNGRGFDVAQVREGMGLGNLRQRAAELGGIVNFDSRPSRGTTVNIDIPLVKQGV